MRAAAELVDFRLRDLRLPIIKRLAWAQAHDDHRALRSSVGRSAPRRQRCGGREDCRRDEPRDVGDDLAIWNTPLPWLFFLLIIANGSFTSILLKNPLFWRSAWDFGALSARRIPASSPHVANTGVGRGMSFANFRRFWAVAANRNSSLAPFGPLRRNRPSLSMRLR